MRRMWINQPSTFQPLHKLHGVLVLAAHESNTLARAYFIEGDVISQQIPWTSLSEGWLKKVKP